MHRRFAIISLSTLCACAAPEEPVLDGLPPAWTQVELRMSNFPRLGQITAEIDGTPQQWVTVDLSVGAIDSSAWINEVDTGAEMTVQGYASNDEGLIGANRFLMRFALRTLADERPTITRFAVIPELDEGPQRRDSGNADVTSWILTQPTDDTLQGRLSATLDGQLCEAVGKTGPIDAATCQSAQVTIETFIDFREF